MGNFGAPIQLHSEDYKYTYYYYIYISVFSGCFLDLIYSPTESKQITRAGQLCSCHVYTEMCACILCVM